MNGSRKNREKVRKMGRSLRISENTPVGTTTTDTIWVGDGTPPKIASTTITNVPDNIMVNYRATIVPDKKKEDNPNQRMTPKEAMNWLSRYTAVSGVPDLKEAVSVIQETLDDCIIENILE